MKTTFYASLVLLTCMILAGAAEENPFELSIVPESRNADSSSISLAKDSKREFFVILTNKSDKSQPVFESWNSWGYQVISFQLILPSGEQKKISVKPQFFTRNFPSTYVIPPNGHQVFPITLDDEWQGAPDFGKPGRTKIKLAAIYEVHESKESGEQKVWTGRIVSETLAVEVNHW